LLHTLAKLLVALSLTGALNGCRWEPTHDNPIDPASPYYRHTGSLSVNVVTLNRLPIPEATVIIPELGRFTITNDSGSAFLDNLQPGSWWMHAYRESIAEAIYARDSVQVVIIAGLESDTTLQLNALPKFMETGVYSVTEGITDDELRYLLRFRASVTDPDGQADLSIVRWTADSVLVDTMQYQPDSAYWWSDLPADSFPGQFEDALGTLFYFEALDQAGLATRSPATHLCRIIHDTPVLRSFVTDTTGIIQPLNLRFNFFARDFDFSIRDSTQYNFLARIFDLTTTGLPVMVYSVRIAPTGSNLVEHTLPNILPPARYYWEVYVLDKFGNSSRSPQEEFTILFPR
jgi:hypothetical protein